MKAFDKILREIVSLKEPSKETMECRIKNELHPHLSSLIKELVKKYKKYSEPYLPTNYPLYETKDNDYFIRADEPKLLKWHSSNGRSYDDAVDVDVETFLKEEIKTPDNVLDLLRRISPILAKDIKIAPWWPITRGH